MDRATVKRIIAERRVMRKVQKICDERNLPYPPELIRWFQKVNGYR